MTWAIAILLFVTMQRLAELVIAQRNTSALLAQGAYEVAADHYWLIVAVHALWLAGLWWLAPGIEPDPALIAVFAVLQACRIWVLMTLGSRWTTRIIVLPNSRRITTGPFRFLSHPNYTVVVAEIAVLPLVFGLTAFAIAFTLLNAVVLTIRIRAENAALAAVEFRGASGDITADRRQS